VLEFLKRSEEATVTSPGPFGKYYLREKINSGGMAEIWLATDSSQKSFAIRLMKDSLRFDFSARRRFVRGCEILEKIGDHECIIGYIEHGKIKGRLYLVMEYLESENLKQLYARQDPVLTENVAQIIIDMARGLEHMHENGFMHLDFKPENVLVTRNGGVRLVDFDLTQPIPEKPKKMTGKNPGTPAYMAPEQLQGHAIGAGVDIFAFGVSAYELLTNQKPFPGESSTEILKHQVDRSDFLTPRQINADIPEALEKIILRCIETNPDQRYPFMGVMERELEAALYVQ
jgi:eukaryotic-like serine/threonine-protein kinase